MSSAPAQSTAQAKPPDRWSLPVELHPQETQCWCWAATGQMTMAYFGKNVSQSEQANLAFHRKDCGEMPTPRPCIKTGEILIKPFGFKYDLATKPLSESAIMYQIHGLRKPIPFAWRFPGGGGHASIVVGYAWQDDGTFLVECLDPFPLAGKDKRSWGGGQRLFIPYARWIGDFDHTFGHAYFNITRQP
jgi:hypothetical protein